MPVRIPPKRAKAVCVPTLASPFCLPSINFLGNPKAVKQSAPETVLTFGDVSALTPLEKLLCTVDDHSSGIPAHS